MYHASPNVTRRANMITATMSVMKMPLRVMCPSLGIFFPPHLIELFCCLIIPIFIKFSIHCMKFRHELVIMILCIHGGFV